jgi:hypothetical protein
MKWLLTTTAVVVVVFLIVYIVIMKPNAPVKPKPEPPCEADCDGKKCNEDNGCGVPCDCPSGKTCNGDGSCECVPKCGGKTDGSLDGCSGFCLCLIGHKLNSLETCVLVDDGAEVNLSGNYAVRDSEGMYLTVGTGGGLSFTKKANGGHSVWMYNEDPNNRGKKTIQNAALKDKGNSYLLYNSQTKEITLTDVAEAGSNEWAMFENAIQHEARWLDSNQDGSVGMFDPSEFGNHADLTVNTLPKPDGPAVMVN